MRRRTLVIGALFGYSLGACSSSSSGGDGAGGRPLASGGSATSGGSNSSGGSGSGGKASGGVSSGGSITSGGSLGQGGAVTAPSGGTSSGGAASGGAASGGAASGGAASGGSVGQGGHVTTQSGGAASGGAKAMGGASSGGAASGGSASGGGSSAGSKFHVFLLLGQSNMAGYPKAQAADKVEDARVRVLGFDDCSETGRQKDKWDTAAPPLHECWNGAIGPGDYFAKTLLPSLPSGDTIGLVPCAISGEKIETFMKVGGSKYDWILQRAKLAVQAGGVIDGMLFHQGESNCGDANWPNNVRTFVSDLRKDLALGDVPFLAGELAYSGNCSQHNPIVSKLPGLISKAFVVSASGLKVDPADTQWNLHFDHDSQVTFGKRYAQKMVEALGL